jgi:hypothetical protein
VLPSTVGIRDGAVQLVLTHAEQGGGVSPRAHQVGLAEQRREADGGHAQQLVGGVAVHEPHLRTNSALLVI